MVLINGAIAGVWSHKLQGKRLHVEIDPFGKLNKDVRAGIERAAMHLAQFYESTLDLKFN